MGTYDTRSGSPISPYDQDETCDKCERDPEDCVCPDEPVAQQPPPRDVEADARRYRWLQAHDMRLPPAAQAHACHHPLTDAEVDRYIDAAIAEQAKEQQR